MSKATAKSLSPKNGPPPANHLKPEEWDFRPLSEDEVEACYRHEYGRQLARRSNRFWSLVAHSEGLFDWPKGSSESLRAWKASRELLRVTRRCFPGSFIVLKGFLNTPWRVMDRQTRLGIVEHLNEEKGHAEALLHSDALSVRTLRDLEMGESTRIGHFRALHEFLSENDFSNTEYGFCAVNWLYPDLAIERAFSDWLSRERKGRGQRGLKEVDQKRKPRRGGSSDRLKWLGALRQRERYQQKDLVGADRQKLKISTCYSNFPDFRKAATKADELLKLFRIDVERI